MSKKDMYIKPKHGAGISVDLDADCNSRLTVSAIRSGRTKRQELLIRLKDSLLRFKSISCVGQADMHEVER